MLSKKRDKWCITLSPKFLITTFSFTTKTTPFGVVTMKQTKSIVNLNIDYRVNVI
jgi:hypothetical protein